MGMKSNHHLVMTQAAFARRHSVSRQTVGGWVAKGMPLRPDGQVYTPEADIWVTKSLSPLNRRQGMRNAARQVGKPHARADRAPQPWGALARTQTPLEQGYLLGTLVTLYALPRILFAAQQHVEEEGGSLVDVAQYAVLALLERAEEEGQNLELAPWTHEKEPQVVDISGFELPAEWADTWLPNKPA